MDLRDHLDWLLDLLLPKRSALLDLQDTPGVTMRVDCTWWSTVPMGGPVLWPEQMRSLASLNLEFELHHAFYGPEDGPAY